MKQVVVALITLALSTNMQAFEGPIESSRKELLDNKFEMLNLKDELMRDALPKTQESLRRLEDTQEKIDVGLKRAEETKKQMGLLRGVAKVIDPLQQSNLGKLTATYHRTIEKLKTLSAQFTRLAGPLRRDLQQTQKDLRDIVGNDGLIDQITKAQDSALSRLQGVGSFLFGGFTAPDDDASAQPQASQ